MFRSKREKSSISYYAERSISAHLRWLPIRIESPGLCSRQRRFGWPRLTRRAKRSLSRIATRLSFALAGAAALCVPIDRARRPGGLARMLRRYGGMR